MESPKYRGFLVVLQVPEWPQYFRPGLPDNYRGLYRMPPRPHPGEMPKYPEEAEAFEADIFGDYCDDETGLIGSYDKALELYKLYSRSPRAYEILYCCEGPEGLADLPADRVEAEVLGYDVVCMPGDLWSIVLGMPSEDWTVAFRQRLNQYWLFDNPEDAEKYLHKYREKPEDGWDIHSQVVLVSRVVPKGTGTIDARGA